LDELVEERLLEGDRLSAGDFLGQLAIPWCCGKRCLTKGDVLFVVAGERAEVVGGAHSPRACAGSGGEQRSNVVEACRVEVGADGDIPADIGQASDGCLLDV
jgi:hypothetical protein